MMPAVPTDLLRSRRRETAVRPSPARLAAAATLAAAVGLAACGRPEAGPASPTFPTLPDAGVGAPRAQSMQLVVDGRAMTLAPDDPRTSQVAATVLEGGTRLTLAALDRGHGVSLSISVTGDRIAPGRYEAFECGAGDTGCPPRVLHAVFGGVTPSGAPDPATARAAWRRPALGLAPAVVVIEVAEETVRPGVGPVRRLVGRLEGDFAALEEDADHHAHVQGPVRHVSGTFDLLAPLR